MSVPYSIKIIPRTPKRYLGVFVYVCTRPRVRGHVEVDRTGQDTAISVLSVHDYYVIRGEALNVLYNLT